MIQVENENEREVLEEFKTKVSDLEQQEDVCLRFLRARDGDISKAEHMLRKAVTWYSENNVASYLNWDPPKGMREDFTFQCTGHDLDGRPVIWVPLGRFDGRPWLPGFKEDVLKFNFHMLETVMQIMKDAGTSQNAVVIGMEQLSLGKITHIESIQMLYHVFQLITLNYPEILKYIFIVNAPWLFASAFALFRPIFTARTLAKIQVFGSDKSKFIPALLERMPRQAIPSDYRDD